MKPRSIEYAVNPRPVKLEKVDDQFLERAASEINMSVSELMRRSVKLLKQQRQLSRGWGFILDLQ